MRPEAAEPPGGLERFDSPGKGRGLRALRRFGVGELLFSCPAYAAVLTVSERGGHCDGCFARKDGLSKCGRCKQAFYCNVECQLYFSMFSEGRLANAQARVCFHVRFWAELESLRDRETNGEDPCQADIDKLDNEKRELIQNDIAALHHFYSKHLEYPDNAALVVLFAQVNCNGFTIEDEELSHLGSAIFPDVALMNHSCCPNVIVTYKGTLAEIRAVKEIEPGEEIFSSYIDLLYPTEDRNDRLKDSYFFICDCRECITKEKDKDKLEICKLNDPPSAETVKGMIKYARNVIEEFRRAKHYKYILCLTLTPLAWCVT
ncbi:N-lysine methyltransferase SMYD2 [Pitangus sulphuratus]|nr:N-lysine methyltransferase SMYD2 [Pitangus sulphuratus]